MSVATKKVPVLSMTK